MQALRRCSLGRRWSAWLGVNPLTAVLAGLAAAALSAGCKDTRHTPGEASDVVVAYRSKSAGFYAAGVAELQQTSAFYLAVWNQTFSTHFDTLASSAELPTAKKPMTGSFYPQTENGTNRVLTKGEPTALQKYDTAFYNGVNTASAWEDKYHTSKTDWAGHCNGFAASTSRHPREPRKSVRRGSVTFAPQDVKALMTELYMSADFQFLGGSRCNDISPNLSPDSRPDPTVMSVCQGLNPGTLHAALANWIGTMQHPVIVDRYTGNQVWNHPVVKYQVLASNYVSAQQAAQAVDGQNSYIFNPNAAKFVQVHTQVFSVGTTVPEVLGQETLETDDLTYILELDQNGSIIGGEWTGDSINKHPNFIWVAFEPLPSNGHPSLGNPNLDLATVLAIWADSVDDPNNQPPDITRPGTAAQTWGKLNAFSAVLDGFSSGAAFAGKQLQLRVTRGKALAGAGVELDLGLNGAALATVVSTGNEVFNIPVTASSGLNRFEFSWKKAGSVVDDEFLRFRLSR